MDMEPMGLNEVREAFLSFMESKGHLRLKSAPLIPQDDNSLLLINSGMAPLKKYFTGEKTPPSKRVTTCQKCIRTPDIERVGKTARHGTFFEMLGNFSFGDYFKKDATAWAWEFCTKVMKLPEDKIWITIYEDDDQTRTIWINEVGVNPDHIVRMGKEDNFWEIGSGPCGPCSEIYFDRGPEHGCGQPDCKVGCECDRFVEFWNLVFTQFCSDGQDHYACLEHPNIDTGMGLERLACIMQGVDNLFEVDTVRSIMLHVMRIAKVEYHKDNLTDVSLRVITDHIRSTTFLVCDGVLPSNEGRGYVLRKLLRRAARHGRLLGIRGNFLSEVCETAIEQSKDAYPELAEKRAYIKKVIATEEEKFAVTIDSGLAILEGYIEAHQAAGKTELSGEDAFKLYDTYGFPLDLTREILSERNMTADEKTFAALMERQKQLSRADREGLDLGWKENNEVDLSAFGKTEFLGYDALNAQVKIMAIIKEGDMAQAAADKDQVLVVLDRSPFYGEGGGQVGDQGVLNGKNGSVLVSDTKKTDRGTVLHIGTVKGSIALGETVTALVDEGRRAAIARAHSATHLLQKALQLTLGDHVQQAGSLVTPDHLRFDFTHFSAVTTQELQTVEQRVNEQILAGLSIESAEMPINEARALGAMALFGEKYGDMVRLVRMGEFSKELCGGTHLRNTALIGSFAITAETSVAAGVRRIEASVGLAVLEEIRHSKEQTRELCETLHTNPAELPHRCEQVMAEIKELNRQLSRLNARIADYEVQALLTGAKQVGSVRVLTGKLAVDLDTLREMGDQIKDKMPDVVAVFASVQEDKVQLLCVCGKAAVAAGAHAGNLIKEVAKLCGGGGGGRPDSATAGGKNPAALPDALGAVEQLVSQMLR